MNRRDLLKMLGLAATTLVLPLSLLDNRYQYIGSLQVWEDKLYRMQSVFVSGIGTIAKAGKVQVYRGRTSQPLLSLVTNVLGGYTRWIAPLGLELVLKIQQLRFEADFGLIFGAVLLNEHGDPVLVSYIND